jgi:dolichyl-phosphate-mannose-protein mannosyltransferase
MISSLPTWWRRPAAPVLAIAAVQLALHLSLIGRYGLHTDELYYVLSGQHPAFGYVDFPPVTPLLARLDTAVFGISPWTLRLLPALTGAGMVVLSGLCALELGGGRTAATLAALVALLSPYLLATWLFQTVEFDELLWLVSIYLLLRLITTGDRRLFLLLGLALGIGFETKLTIVALWAAIAVAVLLSSNVRPLLRTRYPWAGAVIALFLAAPNIAWQVANGFPTLTYLTNHSSDIAQGGGPASFIELFVLLTGPVLFPLWVAGLVLLWRKRDFRPLAVLVAIAVLAFLPDGKAYYPAPTVPFALAAGCVAVTKASSLRRTWVQRGVVIGGVIEAALVSTIVLPLVPADAMHRTGIDRLNPDFANTVGWPEMTQQVGAVFNSLPPAERMHGAILTAIDGQAGAIDIYGGAGHLPQAISPHLSFWYWKPAGLEPTAIVTVGYSRADLGFLCGTISEAGHVRIPYGVDNLNQGAPILVCTDLRDSLGTAWRRLRNFS